MTTEKKQKIKLVLRKDFMSRSPMTSVMALGTFDGVHIAHRALISEAVKLKKKLGADSVGVW